MLLDSKDPNDENSVISREAVSENVLDEDKESSESNCLCKDGLTVKILETAIGKRKIFTYSNIKDLSCCNIDKQHFIDLLNNRLEEYEINTCLRISHFMAQVTHESMGLLTTMELASGWDYDISTHLSDYNLYKSDPDKYKTDKKVKRGYNRYLECIKMENTEVGDGPKFKGKGLLQLTWKKNYRIASEILGKPEILSNPLSVADDMDLAILVSCYFWKETNLNKYADKDDLFNISKLVNLPTARKSTQINGYSDREKYLEKFKSAFNQHKCK